MRVHPALVRARVRVRSRSRSRVRLRARSRVRSRSRARARSRSRVRVRLHDSPAAARSLSTRCYLVYPRRRRGALVKGLNIKGKQAKKAGLSSGLIAAVRRY